MFGIGLTEMILVGIVILLLFSPRELPGMIKAVAQVYGSIRRTAEEFRAQVMEAEELREPIEEIRAAYHGTKQELASAQNLARKELARARSEALKAQQRLGQLVREEQRRDLTPPQTPAPDVASGDPPKVAATHPTLQGRVSQSDASDDDPVPPFHHATGGLEPDPQAAHPESDAPGTSGRSDAA